MTAGRSLRAAIVPLYLFACLLLGGSTRAEWPNLALQLAAIAMLAWAALAVPRVQSGQPGRTLVRLALAMLLLMALQLVPLPPSLWTALPGREAIARGFDLLGQPRPWLPLSLAPYETMTAALWLLPPLAVLAGILRLGAYRETMLGTAIGLATFGGVLLGAMQVTSGDVLASPWYLYAITNNGKAPGFFANSNHMSTLLIVTVPFLVALLGVRRERSRRVHQKAGKIAILVGAMVIIVIGLALNRSLAGIGLGIPVAAASLLVGADLSSRRARWGLGAVGLVGLAAVIGIFASPLTNNLTAPGADQNYASRYTSFSNSLRAAAEVFPVGSGSGSFTAIYPAYENPDIVEPTYVNHVHNDFIELALETGLPGMLLIAALLLWWVGRTVAIWRAPVIDHFARAATIASAAMLAHSLVDYPLRTSALAALFAMCLALMAGPRRRLTIEDRAEQGAAGARHLSLP